MQTVVDYEHGISAVDSGYGRPAMAAVHLVVEGGRAAIVDTGHNDSVPRVLAALSDKGIGPEQVDWVILTHVHLDHAGAAGRLIERLPNALLTVHPRGARHMIDPGALFTATIAVYGEEFARRVYGEIVPVPAERVVETPDEHRIRLAGRELRFLDTPGHARHHVCVVDSRSGHVFTGDAFGISYREFDLDGRAMIFPTTTPVQFDPDAMHRSIDRLLALRPPAVYLTHFGQVRDVARLGNDLHRLVDAHAAIALGNRDAGPARSARIGEGVRRLLLAECRRHGLAAPDAQLLELLEHDIGLNTGGLVAWLDARR